MSRSRVRGSFGSLAASIILNAVYRTVQVHQRSTFASRKFASIPTECCCGGVLCFHLILLTVPTGVQSCVPQMDTLEVNQRRVLLQSVREN